MRSFKIHIDDFPFVTLTEWNREQLHEIIDSKGVLYWGFKGMWNKLSAAVLENSLRQIEDLEAFKRRHPYFAEHVIRYAGMIHWEQSVPIRDSSVIERVPLLRPHSSLSEPKKTD